MATHQKAELLRFQPRQEIGPVAFRNDIIVGVKSDGQQGCKLLFNNGGHADIGDAFGEAIEKINDSFAVDDGADQE